FHGAGFFLRLRRPQPEPIATNPNNRGDMIGMFDHNRPSIRIRPDRFDALLEVVAAVLLIYTMIHLGAYYGQLPERIPIHFNAAGQPDGWAMRGSIFILTGAKVFLYILLTGVSFLPPRYYNIPWKI